ncbi:hypothetical protein K438DRAFT_1768802 [Mycena galopus ATCC 62051]|nr:hypothetical protein K438DRAFT_1768802 [Mycena galopus ATCC 62051]
MSTPGSPERPHKMSLSDMQRKMSESASDAGMGIPRPPSAIDLHPNAYPYPIATTAPSLLARANPLSSPSNRQKQHYVRRAEYRGHRYSSSEDMYLPSASASNGVHWRWEWERAEGAASPARRTSRNAGPPRSSPRTSTPRALPRRVHRPPRAMSAGARLCAWAMGEEELRRMGALLPPSAPPHAPSVKNSSHPPHPCPSPRFLPFPTTRVPTATTRPSASLAPPPMRGPRLSRFVRGAGGDGRCGRRCRPRRPPRPQERRDALASTAPRCVAVHPPLSSSASFSSNTASSPFAPKHKQSPFASRYEYEYLTTTDANANNADDGQGRASASPSPSPSPSPTGHFRNGRVKGMVRSFESGSPERGCGGGGGSGFRSGEGGSGFLRWKASQSEGEDGDDEDLASARAWPRTSARDEKQRQWEWAGAAGAA